MLVLQGAGLCLPWHLPSGGWKQQQGRPHAPPLTPHLLLFWQVKPCSGFLLAHPVPHPHGAWTPMARSGWLCPAAHVSSHTSKPAGLSRNRLGVKHSCFPTSHIGAAEISSAASASTFKHLCPGDAWVTTENKVNGTEWGTGISYLAAPGWCCVCKAELFRGAETWWRGMWRWQACSSESILNSDQEDIRKWLCFYPFSFFSAMTIFST